MLSLEWQPYNLRLKYPFVIANYSRIETPVVLTKIEYKGMTGYGEASLPQYLGETQKTVHLFLSKVDLSRFNSPENIEEIMSYVDSLDKGNTAAKASIDIALHDLLGKIKESPLYSFLGFLEYKTPFTSYTIGIDSPETIRTKVKEVEGQFRLLKVKLTGTGKDKEIIKTIRSVSDLPLSVDLNQSWTDRQEALDMIFWLRNENVILIEQPMDKMDLDGNAWLTQNSPLPVFADESVQRLSDMYRIKGAFSGINIKLMKCTGIGEAYKMLQLAPDLGFRTMIGCMTETSCAISAAAHLSVGVEFADLDGNILIVNDCFSGVYLENSCVKVSGKSGLGIKMNGDLINLRL